MPPTTRVARNAAATGATRAEPTLGYGLRAAPYETPRGYARKGRQADTTATFVARMTTGLSA
jgi:hypothetical protein